MLLTLDQCSKLLLSHFLFLQSSLFSSLLANNRWWSRGHRDWDNRYITWWDINHIWHQNFDSDWRRSCSTTNIKYLKRPATDLFRIRFNKLKKWEGNITGGQRRKTVILNRTAEQITQDISFSHEDHWHRLITLYVITHWLEIEF